MSIRDHRAFLPWLLVLALAGLAGLSATVVLAQPESGGGGVNFSIAGEYGVKVATVTFDGVIDPGQSASLSFGTTTADHLFEITGPSTATTDVITLQAGVLSLPSGWLYQGEEATLTDDAVRMTYQASEAQFRGLQSIPEIVVPESQATVNLLNEGMVAPVGRYGGTVTVELGQRDAGAGGDASFMLTVTVVPSE